MSEPVDGERIQKVLAGAGVASRREVDRWLQSGRLAVNGRVATPGDRLSGGEKLTLDGKPLALPKQARSAPRVLLYYKPEGEVCTRSDPQGRPTIFDRLPPAGQGRWITVGRLDVNTSGLLLLTTDGDLANRLMHPSWQVEREYAVRVLGEVPATAIQRLLEGVALDDGPARFLSLVEAGGSGANHWYHVVIGEGRKREVRRLWEAVGVRVSRLIRVRFGPLALPPDMRTGDCRELRRNEFAALYRAVDLKMPAAAAPPVPRKTLSQKGGKGSPRRRK